MDLKFLSLASLVLAAPCCVFYATGHQIYEFDRYTWFLIVLWFDITQTDKHTGHTSTNRRTHI